MKKNFKLIHFGRVLNNGENQYYGCSNGFHKLTLVIKGPDEEEKFQGAIC